jgi:hypothetical protein
MRNARITVPGATALGFWDGKHIAERDLEGSGEFSLIDHH